MQSLGDPVVHHTGSVKVFERLGSDDKEYLMVNYNRHGIINNEGAGRVFKAVEEFINRIKTL